MGFEYQYRVFHLRKRSGGLRQIHAPTAVTLEHQRLLLHALADERVHPAATAFRPGRSTVDNAWPHQGARYVFQCDLKDFFPQTRAERVRDWFHEHLPLPQPEDGWWRLLQAMDGPARPDDLDPDVFADEMVRLTTTNGALPQGAATSPLLSNLLNVKLDRELWAAARAKNLVYTRYADDITLSSKRTAALPGREALVDMVRGVVGKYGYSLNPKKTRIQTKGRIEVTDVCVNDQVGISRARKRMLDAVEHRFGLSRAMKRLHAAQHGSAPSLRAWAKTVVNATDTNALSPTSPELKRPTMSRARLQGLQNYFKGVDDKGKLLRQQSREFARMAASASEPFQLLKIIHDTRREWPVDDRDTIDLLELTFRDGPTGGIQLDDVVAASRRGIEQHVLRILRGAAEQVDAGYFLRKLEPESVPEVWRGLLKSDVPVQIDFIRAHPSRAPTSRSRTGRLLIHGVVQNVDIVHVELTWTISTTEAELNVVLRCREGAPVIPSDHFDPGHADFEELQNGNFGFSFADENFHEAKVAVVLMVIVAVAIRRKAAELKLSAPAQIPASTTIERIDTAPKKVESQEEDVAKEATDEQELLEMRQSIDNQASVEILQAIQSAGALDGTTAPPVEDSIIEAVTADDASVDSDPDAYGRLSGVALPVAEPTVQPSSATEAGAGEARADRLSAVRELQAALEKLALQAREQTPAPTAIASPVEGFFQEVKDELLPIQRDHWTWNLHPFSPFVPFAYLGVECATIYDALGVFAGVGPARRRERVAHGRDVTHCLAELDHDALYKRVAEIIAHRNERLVPALNSMPDVVADDRWHSLVHGRRLVVPLYFNRRDRLLGHSAVRTILADAYRAEFARRFGFERLDKSTS